MSVDAAQIIFFSPTGTTRHVLMAIGHGTGLAMPAPVDLTLPDGESQATSLAKNTLAIIGTPVYAGRVPETALARLDSLAGDGTPAVLVVVYGNRAFEDALLELVTFVSARGFIPLVAGAFVGEHSFSSLATPIAVGLPDATDLTRAEQFGRLIRERLRDTEGEVFPALVVPGSVPYRERAGSARAAPVSREDVCMHCGQCATVCPVAAIWVTETVETDPTVCIQCCACLRTCPSGARTMADPHVLAIAQRLTTNCATRREPELFL